jgi:hypothetical protein
MLTNKYGESKIPFSEIRRSVDLTIGTSVAGHRTAYIFRVVFFDYCIEYVSLLLQSASIYKPICAGLYPGMESFVNTAAITSNLPGPFI